MERTRRWNRVTFLTLGPYLRAADRITQKLAESKNAWIEVDALEMEVARFGLTAPDQTNPTLRGSSGCSSIVSPNLASYSWLTTRQKVRCFSSMRSASLVIWAGLRS